ncbi:gliding motility-associated-like protein [Neolewinella xylanilytica]|uniref:Gliding motility-associated-like protein n=1 Tax=Neolewinella xylanilytica TaxID=1514080 RepID=A0A2S6I189_9BACT|nr:LamG-like jellyroll fold domain-containing protein [Neolewinella xylanilytica]PPK84722.1 gliding motility-associated-like protein [Neolewinella xylanilytica]
MRTSLLALFVFPVYLLGQTADGLVAYYPFESNLGDAGGGSENLGVGEGAIDFDCGVNGEALYLATAPDLVRIPGGATTNVNRIFADLDFTVSFYFKPIGTNPTQYLLSKRSTDCTSEQYFQISYAGGSRTLRAVLKQGNAEIALEYTIENASCWQYVTVRRRDRELRLFLNGESVASETTPGRIDVDNDGDLLIGGSECRSAAEENFTGLIDELQFYGVALDDDVVASLYGRPDQILTPDTRIFLGESVQIELNSNCGTDFSWTPAADVTPRDVPDPLITPTQAGRRIYRVSIADNQYACIATDSIEIQVIDPNSLSCDKVYFPRAFTPNGIGPAQNETFGISNPFAVGELVSLEIFDRYGGTVFSTADAFERWDGSFRNEPVSPGVMLWRVVYRCEGQEIVRTGSVTILR